MRRRERCAELRRVVIGDGMVQLEGAPRSAPNESVAGSARAVGRHTHRRGASAARSGIGAEHGGLVSVVVVVAGGARWVAAANTAHIPGRGEGRGEENRPKSRAREERRRDTTPRNIADVPHFGDIVGHPPCPWQRRLYARCSTRTSPTPLISPPASARPRASTPRPAIGVVTVMAGTAPQAGFVVRPAVRGSPSRSVTRNLCATPRALRRTAWCRERGRNGSARGSATIGAERIGGRQCPRSRSTHAPSRGAGGALGDRCRTRRPREGRCRRGGTLGRCREPGTHPWQGRGQGRRKPTQITGKGGAKDGHDATQHRQSVPNTAAS